MPLTLRRVPKLPPGQSALYLPNETRREKRKKKSLLVAAAWNQQRAEVENVVVNGIQVVKKQKEGTALANGERALLSCFGHDPGG